MEVGARLQETMKSQMENQIRHPKTVSKHSHQQPQPQRKKSKGEKMLKLIISINIFKFTLHPPLPPPFFCVTLYTSITVLHRAHQQQRNTMNHPRKVGQMKGSSMQLHFIFKSTF